MQSFRQLSRLLITGHIYEHTPMCVLMEIADAHGIKYEQKDSKDPKFPHHLMASIHQTPVPRIEIKETKLLENTLRDISEWQFIARFVSKYSQWPQNKLIQAYNFLISFMNTEDPLEKVPINFISGLQTPSDPCAVNACVLYKTCIYHRLNINSRTTISQMTFAVRMLRENVESLQRRAKVFVERDAKRIDLINTLLISPYEIKDPNPAMPDQPANYDILPVKSPSLYGALESIYDSLNDVKTLQSKISPTTDQGAIALAALNYGIDISKARNPTREYSILHLSGRNDYKPADPWLCYWYGRNPRLFDLAITFNPAFPTSFYTGANLQTMVHNEGYSVQEIAASQPYELMQLAYLAETFYNGEMPNMKSNGGMWQTFINLDDLDTIPTGELLCFGQLDAPLYPVSVSELIDSLNANQNFSSPFDSTTVFTGTTINKLKLLLQDPVGYSINLAPASMTLRRRLLDTINQVELMSRQSDEETRQFSLTYKNAMPETKQAIQAALINLLNIGMTMRGWDGKGDHPVLQAPVPPDQESSVAIAVTEAIASYESICRSLGRIGLQINNLPLVVYRDGEYQKSTSSEYGFTIGDRLTIVKSGDVGNNIQACIRLSSNWLCASVHKYMLCIGLPAPFNIMQLRHIS